MHPHQFRSDPRPQMAGRVNPLADRIAELLEAELRDVREVLRCNCRTLHISIIFFLAFKYAYIKVVDRSM